MHQETNLIHQFRDPDAQGGMVNPPIYLGSTIVFPEASYIDQIEPVQDHHQLKYGKYGAGTQFHLEKSLASLEGGDYSFITASGINAIHMTLMAFLSQGDHLLMPDSSYYPSREFSAKFLSKFGIETQFYNPYCGADIETLITQKTKVIYLESPGSNTFEIQDIPAICKVAKAHGIITILDNSWSSGLYFKPFEHGVDVSVIAATKYLSGHSDVMMGVATTTKKHFRQLQEGFKFNAATASAHNAYLVQRGLRTLGIRKERCFENMMTVINAIKKHPKIKAVLHPALPKHPNHDIWKRDFSGAASLFSVVLDKAYPKESIYQFLDKLSLFSVGYSWGGYESVAVPFSVDYKTLTPWDYGNNSCIRFCIGLEHPEDLIKNLNQAFPSLIS